MGARAGTEGGAVSGDWYAEYLRRKRAAIELERLREVPRVLVVAVMMVAAFALAVRLGWEP